MIELRSGQHFGQNKTTLQLHDCILVEAGYTPHINVPWHYHENAYFYYHIRGHLAEVNKKKNYTCVPGTSLFHYWQEAHCNGKFSTDALFYHLEFKKSWFERHGIKKENLEGDFKLDHPLYQSAFRKIYDESKINDNSTPLSIDGLSLQVFAEMMRFSSREKHPNPVWVQKVRDVMHDCFSENITLAFLSDYTGLHPVYLSREFPKYFKMGFGDYLRKIKLEKAAVLLQTTNMTVTQIAFSCGFSDQSHFIRTFSATNQITPLQYRKRFNNNK
jgi:AraC family transcriptional regulator